MRLFGRRAPEPVPDENLPLDVDRAARLRVLVRQAFAEQGREVVVHADHMEDDEGSRFGLWNLAAVCAEADEADWPELVARHVQGLLNPDDIERVPEAELLVSVHQRIIEAAQMTDETWHPTAPRLGEGLLVVLAVDRPEQVATPPESFWDERGGVEHWRKVGLTNLRALLDTVPLKHERITPADGIGGFDVVMGDSFFSGSLALLLDDVLARFSPGQDTGNGVLVSVPFRHQLAWSVVEPGPQAVQALHNLFGFAAAGFSDAPGPVSPHVYWVRDGRWRQLTRVDEDGFGELALDEEAARVLGIGQE